MHIISRAALDEAFATDLLLPLPAVVALYASFTEKSPGLAQNATKKGAYPPEIAAALEHAKPAFEATAFSMSPESLSGIVQLIRAAGVRSVLEFGAGVSTFILPPLLAPGGRYLSIEEDADYAAPIRRRASELFPDVKLAIEPLAIASDRKAHLLQVDGKKVRPQSFAGLNKVVLDYFREDRPQLVLIDGPSRRMKWGRYAALADLKGVLAPGTLILLDDALRYREIGILSAWQAAGLVKVIGVYCVGTGVGAAIMQ